MFSKFLGYLIILEVLSLIIEDFTFKSLIVIICVIIILHKNFKWKNNMYIGIVAISFYQIANKLEFLGLILGLCIFLNFNCLKYFFRQPISFFKGLYNLSIIKLKAILNKK